MNFASDNTAPMAPQIIAALTRVNDGFANAYGGDACTARVEEAMAKFFDHEVAVFLVPTGTAANALSLAHITPSWGGVLCHDIAHIKNDECGAPEFFGNGIKLYGLLGDNGKLTPQAVQTAITRHGNHRPHHVEAASLSITQATEAGTIYRTDEIAALSQVAHAHDLPVHMDGARLGNALARMNVAPADVTWKAGIDVLSFGATKAGAMAAEAVVFFDRTRAAGMAQRRKRSGQLISKHRFVAAQFEAYLQDDCWLRLSRHANDKADRLAEGLRRAGCTIVWAVEANIVFAVLPQALDASLRAAGASYYARNAAMVGDEVTIAPDQMLVRMVTSFATQDDEIDRFVDLVRRG